MATYSSGAGEHRWSSSPRPKGRENTKNIPCRNIQIYGHCKNEGCPYNHNPSKSVPASGQSESAKKRLNVDSPSFTPTATDTSNATSKSFGLSPRAASAAPFQPKGGKSVAALATPPSVSRHHSSEWSNSGIPEFVPQTFQHENAGLTDVNPSLPLPDTFHPFDGAGPFVDLDAAQQGSAAFNPYVQDTSAGSGATIYNQQNTFTQPLNYHLYAPLGPHRENLLAYQRTAHDFFTSEGLRQDLQRKAEATLQVLPHSSLPPTVEHFHSLVPLDVGTQRSTAAFGYNTWLYKVSSTNDGNYYALRRVEGFRLTHEHADAVSNTIAAWKRISHANCVTVYDPFTTRAFGDSSLIFITDYHPLSKTLAEHHFSHQHPHSRSSRSSMHVPEHVIWGYLVQIASALRTIHANQLCARQITPSKILLTGKNRVRLNGNAIMDVLHLPTDSSSREQFQLEDLRQLGRLALSLATVTPNPSTFAPSQSPNSSELPPGLTPTPVYKALESLNRSYSERLKTTVASLLDAGNPSNPVAVHDASSFAASIADHALSALDAALHADDALTSDLARELENGRLLRLMSKLGFVNERPEYSPHDPTSATINSSAPASLQRAAWSETGDRYYLKLFRDYVFHQVAAEDGRPVIDLGHVISCLNKLDAGSEERIALVTRDEQNVIVVSYREVKRGLESAFQELRSASQVPAGVSMGSGMGIVRR